MSECKCCYGHQCYTPDQDGNLVRVKCPLCGTGKDDKKIPSKEVQPDDM